MSFVYISKRISSILQSTDQLFKKFSDLYTLRTNGIASCGNKPYRDSKCKWLSGLIVQNDMLASVARPLRRSIAATRFLVTTSRPPLSTGNGHFASPSPSVEGLHPGCRERVEVWWQGVTTKGPAYRSTPDMSPNRARETTLLQRP